MRIEDQQRQLNQEDIKMEDRHKWINNLHSATESPIWIGSEDQGPSAEKEKRFKAVVNTTTNKVSSVVGKQYQVIQHKDVATSFVEACENLNLDAKFHTQRGDDKMVIDVTFPEARIGIAKGEEFLAGFRLINSYNKQTGVIIAPRLVRLVCLNGMMMKSQNFVQVFNYRHNTEMAKNFGSYIERALRDTINAYGKLRAIVEANIADSAEWKAVEQIAEKLLSRDNHRKAIFDILRKNVPAGEPITRWDFYNAITQHATHGAQIKPSVEEWLQQRAETVLKTPLERLKPIEVQTP